MSITPKELSRQREYFTIELEPASDVPYWYLVYAYGLKGMYEESIAAAKQRWISREGCSGPEIQGIAQEDGAGIEIISIVD